MLVVINLQKVGCEYKYVAANYQVHDTVNSHTGSPLSTLRLVGVCCLKSLRIQDVIVTDLLTVKHRPDVDFRLVSSRQCGSTVNI